MHATLELARRIDRAEIEFCAFATLGVAPDGATLERGGGLAVYSAPGSPVNKVLGLGLGVECSDDDLDAIEDFYAERGCPVQIELCPLTTPDLPSRPRCSRIRSMTSGSSMLAITRSFPPQRLQVSMSMAKTRFKRCAQLK